MLAKSGCCQKKPSRKALHTIAAWDVLQSFGGYRGKWILEDLQLHEMKLQAVVT